MSQYRRKSRILITAVTVAVAGWLSYNLPLVFAQLPTVLDPVTTGTSIPERGGVFRHIRTAVINYSTVSARVAEWQAGRHDLFIQPGEYGGSDPRMRNPNARVMEYKDFSGIYLPETWAIRAHAAANGFEYEQYYLHMDIDYTNGRRWYSMDRFGNWEKAKGVLTSSNGRFTDETADAYDTGAEDVPISESVYLAMGEPFDEINMVISQGRVDGFFRWEYWNGTEWALLPLRSDGTSEMMSDGQILFTPPVDWAPTSVNGSRSKWWVRGTVFEATTPPIASRIYGDNWLTGRLSRGWAANNSGRVKCCGGEIDYDPNPPSNATARFKHQSRVRSFFGTNNDNFLTNNATVQNDQRVWAHYLVQSAAKLISGRFSGIMLDNVDSITELITTPTDWQDHMDWKRPYSDELAAAYDYFRDAMRGAAPGAWVGANAGSERIGLAGDWTLIESFSSNTPGEHNFNHLTRSRLTFDDFLPANNPQNTKGVMIVLDSTATDQLDTQGNWYSWDRADRRPMAALAFYYIGANENTYFNYNSVGYTYAETDQVRYYSSTTTTLAAPITKDTSSGPKTLTLENGAGFPVSNGLIAIGETGEHLIYTGRDGNTVTFTEAIYNDYAPGTSVKFVTVARQSEGYPSDRVHRWVNWFPAMGVDIGDPDPKGHKAGNRDTAWVSGSAIGDGGRNIWRRDFTNAIVLLRPAVWNTTAARYNMPRGPFELGGAFFRLRANGTTDPEATSQIYLREGEAAILMKHRLTRSQSQRSR